MDKFLAATLKEIPDPPQEFQVLPEGRIEIEGDLPAFLDEASARQIVGRFERRGNDMVIDYEHQVLKGTQAPAAGWIKKLIYKGKDGLWAAVEWTEKAKSYLKNREYRYFSPVFWVSAKDRKVVSILNVSLTNLPKINNLRPIIAKMSLDEAREAQEDRSKQWGIGIKEGGHVRKPGEWENVPDDEFLDPVNFRYPCPDAEQTRAAAVYWAREENQAQYTSEERAILSDRLDKFRKKYQIGEYRKEASMLEKIKELLGMEKDATEAKVVEAVELLVNKVKGLEAVVACKEVLEAIGAREGAKKDEVLTIIAGLKAPADAAVKLSQEVARLSRELAEMKQNDLIQLALKEGKTSPEELEKWGRELAGKSPEQFRLIVLSRPAGSVIPVGGIPPAPPNRDGGLDENQKKINAMMGISDEVFKKYNK